jgi:alpha-D-ribose 1-methylphosphonate 5-phosphate C-P lyase
MIVFYDIKNGWKTGKLFLIASIFQISDGIKVVVPGALHDLQDVKIPIYYICCLLDSWFPDHII